MICPLCHRPAAWNDNPWRPFCSERCQLTDLGTWASEEYRVPGPSLTMESASENSEEKGVPAGRRQEDRTISRKCGNT